MLKRVYSRTLDTFKTIELNEGFNFIVSKATNGKSNNGTGKTSLLQIINFCLCSSTENIVSYEDINGNEFSIDLEKDNQIITISRSPMKSNVVKIIDIHNVLGQGILNDEEISVDNAKKMLNTYFFATKNRIDTTIPSFRLLISPFMKRGAYAFNNLYKTHAVEKNVDTQLKNSFLLDMNVQQIYSLKDIIKSRSKYLKLKEIKETDFIWNKKNIPELKKNIDLLTSSINNLKNELDDSVINVENQHVINDINNLNDTINTLTKRKYYLKNSIRTNRNTIENAKIMSNKEIEILIAESKILVKEESVKSITEVQNFHKKLITFRTQRTKRLIEKNILELESVDLKLDTLYTQKETLNQQLENNKYLQNFYNLNKEILQKRLELDEVQKQYDTYKEINKIDSDSMDAMKNTMERMEKDLPSKEFEFANSLFKKYTHRIFDDIGELKIKLKKTGDYSSRGFNFEWKISKKSSSGYLKGCIAIYDLIIMEINSYLNSLFLIHDSSVFESTDKSYVANLLNNIYLSTKENNFQYICCLNDDQIILNDLIEDLQELYSSDNNILTQESPLFGISFSK